MSSEAAQYGRHGFELNGLFVDDGIIRSFHPLPPGAMVVLDGESDGEVDVAPLIGVALCEFPDEDGGACHASFCLVALLSWGVSLYDGAAPGGHAFIGISHAWPHDRAHWRTEALKRKGLPTDGEEAEPAFERSTLAQYGINPVTGERLDGQAAAVHGRCD
jgi:hypothetical protein